MPETSRIDPDRLDAARFNMVQQQVRPWGVTDDRVLATLAEIPRESFVPDAYRSLAYADIEIPLRGDRAMLAPKIIARMLQAVDVQPGEKALEIGAGNGYLAACMAQLGARVICMEVDPDLAQDARARIDRVTDGSVEVRIGDGLSEPVDGGPFDIIAVSGSVPSEAPLAALQDQLTPNGRLFIIVGQPPVMEAMLIARAHGRGFRREILFETCSAALSQAPAPDAFVF